MGQHDALHVRSGQQTRPLLQHVPLQQTFPLPQGGEVPHLQAPAVHRSDWALHTVVPHLQVPLEQVGLGSAHMGDVPQRHWPSVQLFVAVGMQTTSPHWQVPLTQVGFTPLHAGFSPHLHVPLAHESAPVPEQTVDPHLQVPDTQVGLMEFGSQGSEEPHWH